MYQFQAPTPLLIADISQVVFKGVRAWSRRALEKAGERVMDVHGDDDDDDEN